MSGKAPPTVSLAEFAADHGVTVTRVRQWIEEGMPHRDTKKSRRVVRAEANAWLRSRAEKEKPSAIKESALRQAAADAEITELKLARMRGALVEVELVEAEMQDLLTRVAAAVRRHVPPEQVDQVLTAIQRDVPPPMPETAAA